MPVWDKPALTGSCPHTRLSSLVTPANVRKGKILPSQVVPCHSSLPLCTLNPNFLRAGECPQRCRTADRQRGKERRQNAPSTGVWFIGRGLAQPPGRTPQVVVSSASFLHGQGRLRCWGWEFVRPLLLEGSRGFLAGRADKSS